MKTGKKTETVRKFSEGGDVTETEPLHNPLGNITFIIMQSTATRLGMWAVAVTTILMIPLVAMQFTNEVVWTPSDFIAAGSLLFGSALVYELATRNMSKTRNRVAVGLVVAATLLYFWAELSVGVFTTWGS